MEKILISACFIGEKVRYNGEVFKLPHPLIQLWKQQNRLVVVCPEVQGGLAVPRSPAEIQQNSQQVLNQQGEDVSDAFNKGAEQALFLCRKNQIKYALLKESSPSCGSEWIYDGSFQQKKIKGAGITTQLLQQQGILVFSEHNIEGLASLLN